MRLSSSVLVILAAVLPSSCGESAAAARPSEGALVLEVGGGQSSLRQALADVGITIGPAHLLRDRMPGGQRGDAAPDSGAGDGGEGASDVGSGSGPGAGGEAAPEPDGHNPSSGGPESKLVTLQRGQTLIHVAKEHLGSGNRFREILDLNGWTDADARRLAEGTKVRVPVDRGVPSSKPKSKTGSPRSGR